MKKIFLTACAVFSAVCLTACSANGNMTSGADGGGGSVYNGDPKNELNDITAAPSGAEFDGVADEDIGAEPSYEAKDFIKADDGAALEAVAGGAAATKAEGDMLIPDEPFFPSENRIPEKAGTLTAGEWTDNDHYSFWQNLFQSEETGWEEYRAIWDRSYCSRVFVSVSAGGKPVENAPLTLFNADGDIVWRARTDNEGKAFLFYSASELSKGDLVLKNELGEEVEITSDTKAVVLEDLDGNSYPKTKKSLDLALLVDTTGSMSDELSYLQKELESVIKKAAADNGNIPVRLSVDFYRDDGDDYVVREFDFTENISEAIEALNAQSADGGGDTPEKVNAALGTVINKLSWNDSATKLLFIILDAPPHSDDFAAVEQMNELTEQAAAKGIRLIPILASGGSKETEFLMRDFALKTGGTYLFLTDDSGVSVGGHIEPTIGNYTVEKLNDLMVRVIDRYLANVSEPAKYIEEELPSVSDTQIDLNETEITSETSAETTAPPITDGEITMRLTDNNSEGDEPPLVFLLSNGTEYDCWYGEYFSVEKFSEGQWTELEPDEILAFNDVEYELPAGESRIFEVYVFRCYKNLTAGKYRVATNVSSEEGTVTVYGEFELF